jgi:hypothetical protein
MLSQYACLFVLIVLAVCVIVKAWRALRDD